MAMCKATILIVEDEAIVAEDLRHKLARLGYEVCGATERGEDALALARARRPDLVLMDICLQGRLDGVQTAQILRRECEVPVIYLTAHSDPATLQRAKLTEPFGYILKPFEEPDLETHIQVALYKHRADQEVRRQREWLQVTLQSIGDAVITSDAAGKVISLNPVAEELTGWNMAEAVNRPIIEVLHIINEKSRQLAPNPVERVLTQGKVVGLANHTALISRDGTERAIEDSAAPIKDAQGRVLGVVMVFRDATDKRRAEEALSRSKEELERLVAERTANLQELVAEMEHFSYTIAHDMRAPLRAMKAFGDIVVNELCANCPQQEPRDFLKRIMTSADRMDALIRDALNYSKAARQELPRSPVDTGRLLRGILDSYPDLQPFKAQIRLEGQLPVVMGNEGGLTQCFSNLLGNAVKFVQPGQAPAVRIWSEPRSGWARIWVEDQGIGIPATMLPRVFDMFSRGHNSYEGTGIGLALVRKVMRRLGGQVGVESEEGKGSRFWLDLRAVEPRAGAKGGHPQP